MLHWTKEDTPRWDAAKRRLFGPEELAATGMVAPGPGSPIADEWWHVTGDDGEVAGYGWLDSEWGDAEITFLVGRDRRGTGAGPASGVRAVYPFGVFRLRTRVLVSMLVM